MKNLKLIGNTLIAIEFTSKPYSEIILKEKDKPVTNIRNILGISSASARASGNLYSLNLLFIHLSIGYMG